MNEQTPARLRFSVTFESRGGDDPTRVTRALALLLKIALRRFGLRCVAAREVPHSLTVVTSAR
jgi:hypothetical protein